MTGVYRNYLACRLRHLVLGRAGRRHAQREIAADWIEAYHKYVARERMERE